mmetsp:Transcript_68874/g.148575  ORF Transcript_68874/g.148575 Transcript_68874/m.148575 type:complete len:170 (-) Transcript_68874:357-866(-)
MDVKTLSENKYMLTEGDIFKLGRVKFIVKETRIFDYQPQTADASKNIESFPLRSILKTSKKLNLIIENSLPSEEHIEEVSELEGKTVIKCSKNCRFCLMDVFSMDDPLVRVCKCSGSVEFVHMNCLRQWVQTKLNMKFNGNCLSVTIKGVECELCKSKFPLTFTHKGKT